MYVAFRNARNTNKSRCSASGPSNSPARQARSTEESTKPTLLSPEDALAKLVSDLSLDEERAGALLKTSDKNDDDLYDENELNDLAAKVKVVRNKLKPVFNEKAVDGKVTQEDAFAILKSESGAIPDKVLKAMIHRLDKDEKGEEIKNESVDVNELVHVFAEIHAKNDRIVATFKALDTSGNGFLSPEELVEELIEQCFIESFIAYGMVEDADTDGDGKISTEEFIKMWTGFGF